MARADFVWRLDAPLARGAGESLKAHGAFMDYWQLGKGRSYEKLYRIYAEEKLKKPPARHLNSLKLWGARYAWQARVARAQELADAALEAQWAERRAAARDAGWDDGELLRKSAQQLLQFLARWRETETQEVREDGTVVVVRTIKPAVSLSQITGALKIADELQRLAAGLETDNVKASFDLGEWQARMREQLGALEDGDV